MPQNDLPVSPAELLGKVVAVERNGRELPRVPACTPWLRAIGVTLGSWGRLRSIALRWRQRQATHGVESPTDGVVSFRGRQIS